MQVRALKFQRFRNLVDSLLEPSPRFNVVSGNNGQGKTNLLETLYLVATLRSFRTSNLAELIASGEDTSVVCAQLVRDGLERSYEVRLRPGKREALLDGKSRRRLGEYFGGFNVVLFAAEDLSVPRGSPGDRRRLLDRAVFNREATFLAEAQRYGRILKSRNSVLRQPRPPLELLDVYDQQLVDSGGRLRAARRRYLDEIGPRFADAFSRIGGSHLDANVAYRCREEDLASALAAARPADLARGKTTVGPHVDDLDFRIGGKPARAYASQGQLRALVLSWKAAEMLLLEAVLGQPPILLLDDVSSELDDARNESLFAFLRSFVCQCFVTTTHPRHIPLSEERLDLEVDGGRVRRV